MHTIVETLFPRNIYKEKKENEKQKVLLIGLPIWIL